MSINAKSVLTFEKCPLVAELKLKILQIFFDAQIFERQSDYKIKDQNVAEGLQKQCFSIIPIIWKHDVLSSHLIGFVRNGIFVKLMSWFAWSIK